VFDDIVYPIASIVTNWICTNCKKSFTKLPSICVARKLYLRSEIEERCENYLEEPTMSYRKAVEENGLPLQHFSEVVTAGASEEEKENELIHVMAHSTIYRWIGDLAKCRETIEQPVVTMAMDLDTKGELCSIVMPPMKYCSHERKMVLIAACFLLRAKKIVSFSNPNRDETRGASP